MKTTLTAALLALAALGSATLPVQSGDAAEVLRFRGDTAFADFFSTSNCLETSAFIFGVDEEGPEDLSFVIIGISQFDICTSSLTLDAFAFVPLDDPDFAVARSLKSATLNAEVEIFDDVSQTSFLVDVLVDWTAVGPLSLSNSQLHIRSPGSFTNFRSQGRSRPAEASGTVSIGTTNFTPEPTNAAAIVLNRDGEVSFIR